MKEILSMKRLVQFIMILAVVFGQACEGDEGAPGPAGPAGPQGAQGPAGPAGPAGESNTAQAFQFPVDFTADENGNYFSLVNFSQVVDAGLELEVNDSDVVLVYMAVDGYTDDDGSDVIFWAQLPQILNFPEGRLQFRYIFSRNELLLLLNADFDLATNTDYTEGWGMRVVVVPGELLNGRTSGPPVDYKNYEEVVKFFNIAEKDVKKINLK